MLVCGNRAVSGSVALSLACDWRVLVVRVVVCVGRGCGSSTARCNSEVRLKTRL